MVFPSKKRWREPGRPRVRIYGNETVQCVKQFRCQNTASQPAPQLTNGGMIGPTKNTSGDTGRARSNPKAVLQITGASMNKSCWLRADCKPCAHRSWCAHARTHVRWVNRQTAGIVRQRGRARVVPNLVELHERRRQCDGQQSREKQIHGTCCERHVRHETGSPGRKVAGKSLHGEWGSCHQYTDAGHLTPPTRQVRGTVPVSAATGWGC